MIIAKNNTFTSKKGLKILNFYSDGCPPCHAFMPNFVSAEETFGKDFDFIIVNTGENTELSGKFGIMGTPTIIIMKDSETIFNKSGVPNGLELKNIMLDLTGNKESKIDKKIEKRKGFFGLFK